MEIVVELESSQDSNLEIGRFVDLMELVDMLNTTFEGSKYSLNAIPGDDNTFVFCSDDRSDFALIEKRGELAFAFSADAHNVVMDAYERWKEENGE